MKKIGIITYHHYNNYGSMLQALALQEAVNKTGYIGEFIDFKPDQRISKGKLLCLRAKRFAVYIKNFKKYYLLRSVTKEAGIRSEQFEPFYEKYFQVGSHHYASDEELMENPPIYDGYIVGSDQTWNPFAMKNPEAFYLTFAPEDKLKGSYAPSIAISSFTSEQSERFCRLSKNIQFLSCREESGAELIRRITGREVTCVLDPALLLTKQDWLQFMDQEWQDDEPYVLQYFLGDVRQHRDFVTKLARKMNCKIVSLPFSYIDVQDLTRERVYCGPARFLSLINKAQAICTDSFHGTIFSINFSKNVFSFCKTTDSNEKSENSRLKDILAKFGLESRLLTGEESPDDSGLCKEINYREVNDILEKERASSWQYLRNMLEKCED